MKDTLITIGGTIVGLIIFGAWLGALESGSPIITFIKWIFS